MITENQEKIPLPVTYGRSLNPSDGGGGVAPTPWYYICVCYALTKQNPTYPFYENS